MTDRPSRGLPVFLLPVAPPMLARAAVATSAVSNQGSVASVHADMPLDARDLETVHLRLHRVINCLVGHFGKEFDAKAINLRNGMGQGTIIDAKHNPAIKAHSSAALGQAEQGLHAATLQGAHADAQQVSEILQHS